MSNYSSYEESVSYDAYMKCVNHRKKHKLPIDIDLEALACVEEECWHDCPFNPDAPVNLKKKFVRDLEKIMRSWRYDPEANPSIILPYIRKWGGEKP